MSFCTAALFFDPGGAGLGLAELPVHLYTSLPRTFVPTMRQSRLASFFASLPQDLSPAHATQSTQAL